MKILFLIRELDVRGGTHKQLLKLLDYTASCNIGFAILTFVIDYDYTYPGFRKYSKQIILFPPRRPWLLRIKGLRKYYSKYKDLRLRLLVRKFDVVNIHDNGLEEIMPLLTNKRIVWQINDLPYYPGNLKYVGLESEDAIPECKTIFEQNLQRVSDITVNVSKNADRLRKFYGRDAHVFYCGIEKIEIVKDINETFKRFSHKKVNLLTSGVLFEFRNYETQLDVVEMLTCKGYDVELRIIGDTKYSPVYETKLKHIIVEKKLQVIMEGRVDEERLKELHKNADIFLFVNIDQSWGLSVFEAMSCGLPVIVSNSVGATEVLQDGRNSIFVEPTNALEITNMIEKLVNERDYYLAISSGAKDFSQTMTWEESYCSKMIDLMRGGKGNL